MFPFSVICLLKQRGKERGKVLQETHTIICNHSSSPRVNYLIIYFDFK